MNLNHLWKKDEEDNYICLQETYIYMGNKKNIVFGIFKNIDLTVGSSVSECQSVE